MSNTEDKTPIDNELKAYLLGEDGVSAAYRQLGAEEPSEELDRLILAAAHNAVKQEKPRVTSAPRQKFALAASFMVGVLVTSMYFNQQGDFAEDTVVPSALEGQVVSTSVEQPAPAFAPAAPAVSAANNAGAEILTPQVSQEALRLGQQVARAVGAAETQEAAQAKAEADSNAGLADDANARREVAAATSAARQNASRAQELASQANAAAPPAASTTAVVADTSQQLEEAMVTGARVSGDDEVDPDYRQSREEWLAEIVALREEAVSEQELLEETNDRLDEEVKLFSETYPDFDLVTELEALEQ